MTDTPDVTPLVDLRIHDRDMQDIFDAAVLDLSTKMPTWVPREDNTEVLLLETVATEVAEAIFAINRLPGAVMTALMKLYGVPRNEGTPATGTLSVVAVDSFGYTIPVGARFSIAIDAETNYVAEAYEGGIINDGFYSAPVSVRITENSSAGNNIGPGTPVYPLDSLPFIESVTVSGLFSGGSDPESDADWLARSARRLRRLSETLVFPQHFRDAALEYPTVEAAVVADNMDVNTAQAGTVTVAVWRSSGNFTTEELTSILDMLDNASHAALTVKVVQMVATPITVNVTITLEPGYTIDMVEAKTPSVLENEYGPGAWPSEAASNFYRVDVARVLDSIPGIRSVRTIETGTTSIPRYSYPFVTVNYTVV